MKGESGFTLMEVLIAVLVLSIGVLGLAGLQTVGVRVNNSAHMRSVATQLSYDMVDRVRANRSGFLEGDYNNPSAGDNSCFPDDDTSTPNSCSPLQVAQEDASEWNAMLSQLLPSGTGAVCLDSTPPDGISSAVSNCDNAGNLYAIKVWWIDGFDSSGNAVTKRFVTTFLP